MMHGMGRVHATLVLCLLGFAAAPRAHAASYGCHVKVVGSFTSDKAIRQLNAYINNGGSQMNSEARAAAYYCRGQLHDLAGSHDEAVADFTSSIEWNPHEAGVYYARGDAYEDISQNDKAAADFAEAVKQGGETPAKQGNLCWQRAVRGRPLDRALKNCDVAIRSEPSNMQWLDIRGLVHFRMRDYAAAIIDLDSVLKVQPRDASALFVRGLAKLRAGDAEAGNADIKAAESIDYHVAETYAVFGIAP
jgi:tetratricopeptide (TPR) repeat protein